MTTRLLPVYLEVADPPVSFIRQLTDLQRLAGDLVEWLPAVGIRDAVALSAEADAVIVPDMSGLAYRLRDEFAALHGPILVVTSEFGTVSMWDWEIRDFLRRRGVHTVTPTSVEEYHDIVRTLGVARRLKTSRMLAYLDDLGAGMQPDIFKRFYWWEDDCVDRLNDAFGVAVEKRSYRELWARAEAISDRRIADAVADTSQRVPMFGLTESAKRESVRMYLALRDDLDEAGDDVIAAGINCLNESATAKSTPCLAWNLLFEERGLMWGCEADLTSMISKYIVWESLKNPVMMTNLYPFLMGDAALKHEKIPYFPPVSEQPENHILAAHCGFFGVVPQSFSSTWTLKPRVLEIVDEDSNAIDARFPEGDVTILKIRSTMDSFTVTPAVLSEYAQFQNSDCLNGAVMRIEDGHRFVEGLASHHAVIATGDLTRRMEVLGQTMGLAMERI